MNKNIFVLVTILFSSSISLKSYTLEKNNISALAISDIHFDPLFDCAKNGACEIFEKLKASEEKDWNEIFFNNSSLSNSTYTQDTNYTLLKNILIENKHSLNFIVKNNYINFVIINGDFLGHNLKKHYYNLNNNSYDGYSNFVKKTIQYISDQIKLSMSTSLNQSITIFPVLGNNDSYVDDYFVDDVDSSFYAESAETWSELYPKIKNSNFIHNGYYSQHIPELNSKLILLNSTLFSQNALANDMNKLDLEAKDQLNWLNAEMQQANLNNEKIILAFHIPSAVDPYSSSVAKKAIMFWKPEYQKMLLDSIQQYKSEIIGIFNSHTHSDALYIDSYNNNKVELFSNLISSISPAHSNNPGFKILHFSKDDADTKLEDIDTYYYDISQPNSIIQLEYNYNVTYKSENVRNDIQNLLNENLFDSYFKYFNLNTDFINSEQQKYYICAVKFITENEFNSCINPTIREL